MAQRGGQSQTGRGQPQSGRHDLLPSAEISSLRAHVGGAGGALHQHSVGAVVYQLFHRRNRVGSGGHGRTRVNADALAGADLSGKRHPGAAFPDEL